MVALALALCVFGSCVSSWRDPIQRPTLEVRASATSPLQIGHVVEFTCIAHNHMVTATLEWRQVKGNSETRVQVGRSELVHVRTITAADHGSTIYCSTWFLDSVDGQHYPYYTKSEKISLQVQGVTAVATSPNPNERIRVDVDPVASSYQAGNVVQYVCNIENMVFPPVELRQVKGDLEMQLYVGYQTGHRWISQNVTTADNGSTITCMASRLDDRFNYYAVNSEPYHMNVN